jgi:hypothetical protein
MPNQCAPANRRLAGQSDGLGKFVRDHCNRSASRGGRWPWLLGSPLSISTLPTAGSTTQCRGASGRRAMPSASPTALPHPRCFTPTGPTRSARYSQMPMLIGDGCSHGLPLHWQWTKRGHIAHSSHSVRPTVTDHKEEKGVANSSWWRKTRYATQPTPCSGRRGSSLFRPAGLVFFVNARRAL